MADGDVLTDGEAMVVAARVQNPEAELAVLGAVLLDPTALADVSERLRPHHFGTLRHRLVYEAMLRLHEAGEGIDMLTLADSLRKAGDLAKAGNVAFLATLDGHVPSVGADPMRYVAMVCESYARRRIREAANGMARAALDREQPVDDIIGSAEQALVEVSEDRGLGGDLPTFGTTLKARFVALEKLWESKSEVPGTPTGLADLDRQVAGLQAGDLIVLGARPSMGKSALAFQIATHVAAHTGPAVLFSLEMSVESVTNRILSNHARVDGQLFRTGRLTDRDWPKLARSMDVLHKIPLVIDDNPTATLHSIRARSRAVQRANAGALSLVVVDYLQLMRGDGGSKGGEQNREQEISSFSRGLKHLARTLRCPVLALSQLNRSLEKRTDKRPMMSDLRESGAIEQDADLILFLYRDEVYAPDTSDKGIAEIIIGKQRNGPTGTVRAAFQSEYNRFENLASDDRVPTRQWQG